MPGCPSRDDGSMTEWEEALLSATERVMEVVPRYAQGRLRTKVVGTGAAGDKTLLADSEAESVIIESLSSTKGLGILSEEKGRIGGNSTKYLAVVDPIDGSANFGRGIPFYCTSNAIAEGPRMSDVTCGMVRNLVSGEVYYAKKGEGATKDGESLTVSTEARPQEALVTLDLCRAPESKVVKLAPLISKVKRQVHFGAAALEVCMLAEGLTDAFVDVRGRMRVTDLAAAYIIAKEAGATVSTPEGSPLDPALDLDERFSFVVSGSAKLHERILALIR